MTKSGDTGQNFVGGLRPHEGLRVPRSCVCGDVGGSDGVPERVGIAMDSAPQLFLGE